MVREGLYYLRSKSYVAAVLCWCGLMTLYQLVLGRIFQAVHPFPQHSLVFVIVNPLPKIGPTSNIQIHKQLTSYTIVFHQKRMFLDNPPPRRIFTLPSWPLKFYTHIIMHIMVFDHFPKVMYTVGDRHTIIRHYQFKNFDIIMSVTSIFVIPDKFIPLVFPVHPVY